MTGQVGAKFAISVATKDVLVAPRSQFSRTCNSFNGIRCAVLCPINIAIYITATQGTLNNTIIDDIIKILLCLTAIYIYGNIDMSGITILYQRLHSTGLI